MKSKKVKFWARIGEVAFFLFLIFYAALEMQYTPCESTDTTYTLSCICITFILIFAEAIVRLIVYFAEILEERK